jgi:hypothetical protein
VSARRQEITIFRDIGTKALPSQKFSFSLGTRFSAIACGREITTSDMVEFRRAPMSAIGFVIFAGKRWLNDF